MLHKALYLVIPLLLLFQNSYTQTKKSNYTLDSLQVLLKHTKNKENRIETFLELANYYNVAKTKNLDSVRFYANEAYKLTSSKSSFEKKKVKALYYLANTAINSKEFDTAKRYIEQINSISKRLNYGTGLSFVNFLYANISKAENNLNETIYHLENAYKLTRVYNIPEDIIFEITLDLSDIYLENNYDRKILSKLLFELEGLITSPKIPQFKKGIFYYQFGFFYEKYDSNYSKAISNYKKSIDFLTKATAHYKLNSVLIHLAEIYQQLNDYENAIETYNKALALKNEETDTIIYYGLGSCYFDLKIYDKSEYNINKAIEAYKIDNNDIGEAKCLKKLGDLYKKKKNVNISNHYYNLAIETCNKGIIELRNQGVSNTKIAHAYQLMSTFYQQIENYKESLKYHTIYTQYKDSINTNESVKITERFNFLQKTTEKNEKIQNLQIQNEIQDIDTRRNQSLKTNLFIGLILLILSSLIAYNQYQLKQRSVNIIERKNEENKLLMREIHHRVKNNLQIVSGLLGFQINNHSDNQELKMILQESQNKVKSMAIIHQDLYNGDQFAKIKVSSYVEALTKQIEKSFSNTDTKIKFNLDVISKSIQISLAIPLGLILNELITNSFKHAFTDNERQDNVISIKFSQIESSSKYCLTFRDNGKGLPANFKIEHSTSFGIQLINELVAQLQGDIKITNQQGVFYTIILNEPFDSK